MALQTVRMFDEQGNRVGLPIGTGGRLVLDLSPQHIAILEALVHNAQDGSASDLYNVPQSCSNCASWHRRQEGMQVGACMCPTKPGAPCIMGAAEGGDCFHWEAA